MSDTPTFNLSIVEIQKRARFDPLRNFDAHRLTYYLDLFRAGRLRDLSLVIDAQEERDDTLACVVPKAKSAVARHGWEVGTIERVPTGMDQMAVQQKEALEHFYNQLRVTNALDQDEVGGVSLLLRQMMDAKSKRYAVHNIVWKPGSSPTATLWFTPLWFFENSIGKMRFISEPYGLDGQDMVREEWLVTKGVGIGIACAVAWTFKHMSLRDWVLYNARCGLPGFEGITDAAPGTPQWQNMVNAVAAAASEFRWVRNRTEEIKTVELGTTGTLPFPALVERMDRALSALWRGADLSTMSAGAGKGQGASVQQEETALLEHDDAAWLSETIQMKLDRLVLDYVFGPDVPALAYFRVLDSNEKDVELDLKIDQFLLGAGFPISQKQVAERYSRPLPEATDTLLTAPAVPAPGDSGFGAPGSEPDNSKPETQNAEQAAAVAAANESAAAGREALFQANAHAADQAARRAVFRPLAERLALIYALKDPAMRAGAAARLRADAPKLYAAVVAKIPDLAKPAEEAIGAALVSGMAEHAEKTLKSAQK